MSICYFRLSFINSATASLEHLMAGCSLFQAELDGGSGAGAVTSVPESQLMKSAYL